MATTEVLLTEAMGKLGAEGDTVKVKAGYARNFLLPRGIAIPVNAANQKYVSSLLKRREEREKQELAQAQTIADKLKAVSIAFPVKTGKGGKLFGAVTTADLIARLKEEGVQLEKKQLSMKPVKNLGMHTLHVKLHHDIVVDYNFEVVSENPIEDTESN